MGLFRRGGTVRDTVSGGFGKDRILGLDGNDFLDGGGNVEIEIRPFYELADLGSGDGRIRSRRSLSVKIPAGVDDGSWLAYTLVAGGIAAALCLVAAQASAAWEAAVCWDDEHAVKRLAEVRAV